MNRVEYESFIKALLLFFLSMSIFAIITGYTKYKRDINLMQTHTLSQMHICSLELVCKEFSIDFVLKKSQETHKLYYFDKEGEIGLSAYFPITKSQDNLLSISLLPKEYQKRVAKLQNEIIVSLVPILIGIFILSILFSIYSLYPLKNALKLTEEFIKDILHDFNTPLSSLRLNSSMLSREIGENKKVKRIESAVERILSLQENLSFYLHNHKMQKEEFYLKELVDTILSSIERSYPTIEFQNQIPSQLKLLTNRQALARVLENLIGNGGKYNQAKGSVILNYQEDTNQLHIRDTGKGIKNPNKIFQRFYTEHERGLGIGLHIVQKLCDELNIKIEVKSKINSGSTFSLDIKNLLNT